MEDELMLMDVFKVLARRWKLIVAVTLIPTILVAGVLLVATKPTFTSTATVWVSQQSVVPQQSMVVPQGLGPLATLMANQSVATVATYVSLAQDPGLYRRVIEQLQLSSKPWRLTARTLARAGKVTSTKDTNMIAIDEAEGQG